MATREQVSTRNAAPMRPAKAETEATADDDVALRAVAQARGIAISQTVRQMLLLKGAPQNVFG